MILPVLRIVIELAALMKGMLELGTDAHGTLIFDKYKEWSPKNHEGTCRAEVGTIGYNLTQQMLLLRWEVIMRDKNKWELSAHVPSRSLEEGTAVESQSKGLYLTS